MTNYTQQPKVKLNISWSIYEGNVTYGVKIYIKKNAGTIHVSRGKVIVLMPLQDRILRSFYMHETVDKTHVVPC